MLFLFIECMFSLLDGLGSLLKSVGSHSAVLSSVLVRVWSHPTCLLCECLKSENASEASQSVVVPTSCSHFHVNFRINLSACIFFFSKSIHEFNRDCIDFVELGFIVEETRPERM